MAQRDILDTSASRHRLRRNHPTKRRGVRTAPIADNLYPSKRLDTCGCHSGSFIRDYLHPNQMSGPHHPGKAVLGVGIRCFSPEPIT